MQIQPPNYQPNYKRPSFGAKINLVDNIHSSTSYSMKAAEKMSEKTVAWLEKWAEPIMTDSGTLEVFLGHANYKEAKPTADDLVPEGTDILIKAKQIIRVSAKVKGQKVEGLETINGSLKETFPCEYSETEEQAALRRACNRQKPKAAYQILSNPYPKIKELLKSLLRDQEQFEVIEELEKAESIAIKEAQQKFVAQHDLTRLNQLGNGNPNSRGVSGKLGDILPSSINGEQAKNVEQLQHVQNVQKVDLSLNTAPAHEVVSEVPSKVNSEVAAKSIEVSPAVHASTNVSSSDIEFKINPDKTLTMEVNGSNQEPRHITSSRKPEVTPTSQPSSPLAQEVEQPAKVSYIEAPEKNNEVFVLKTPADLTTSKKIGTVGTPVTLIAQDSSGEAKVLEGNVVGDNPKVSLLELFRRANAAKAQ